MRLLRSLRSKNVDYILVGTYDFVITKFYNTTFFNNKSLIAFTNDSFGMAPCDICGAAPIGQNMTVGILLTPKAPANSCSSSVLIL